MWKFEDLTSKNDTVHTNIQINGPKLQHVEVWLGNNQENFQLRRINISENIAVFLEATFLDTRCSCIPKMDFVRQDDDDDDDDDDDCRLV